MSSSLSVHPDKQGRYLVSGFQGRQLSYRSLYDCRLYSLWRTPLGLPTRSFSEALLRVDCRNPQLTYCKRIIADPQLTSGCVNVLGKFRYGLTLPHGVPSGPGSVSNCKHAEPVTEPGPDPVSERITRLSHEIPRTFKHPLPACRLPACHAPPRSYRPSRHLTHPRLEQRWQTLAGVSQLTRQTQFRQIVGYALDSG